MLFIFSLILVEIWAEIPTFLMVYYHRKKAVLAKIDLKKKKIKFKIILIFGIRCYSYPRPRV